VSRSRVAAAALALVLLVGCGDTSPSQRELADLRARAEEAVSSKDACQQAVKRINELLAEARRKFDAAALGRFQDANFTGAVMVPVDAATVHAELATGYCGDFR
jgi:hypothetical protein